MTIGMMRRAGVEVERDGVVIRVRAGQRYRAGTIDVEPDATAASYFLAAAALVGGEVTVPGLGEDSLQGDLAFVDVLREMGATVRFDERGATVAGNARLRGVDRDFRGISDTFLTAAAIAPFASGPTRIRGIAHTRRQESDRVAAVATELGRIGVRVVEHDDALEIEPASPHGARHRNVRGSPDRDELRARRAPRARHPHPRSGMRRQDVSGLLRGDRTPARGTVGS